MFSKSRPLALLAVLSALSAGGQAAAQDFYKYQAPDGTWVYADRPPEAATEFEQWQAARPADAAEVRLYRREDASGETTLIAQNTYYGPVQLSFEVVPPAGASDGVRSETVVLPARSEVELLALEAPLESDAGAPEYRFRYVPGDPAAQHSSEEPYRLPFALASSFRVSQAFPTLITHKDPSSQYAIDFVMPVGTGVYAARGGTVIEVAADFFESGLDPAQDGSRANIVRVLHDDGTMALYAHLNWNSIRVMPGQRVARGEYLADSGNTGFSSGPHLHFVVQRNSNGTLISVPLEFLGPSNARVTLSAQDLATAY